MEPEGALLGTLRGAVRYDAGSGAITSLAPAADPRVYAIRREPGAVLLGTQGGLTIAWKSGNPMAW